jgi:hypothetical protein
MFLLRSISIYLERFLFDLLRRCRTFWHVHAFFKTTSLQRFSRSVGSLKMVVTDERSSFCDVMRNGRNHSIDIRCWSWAFDFNAVKVLTFFLFPIHIFYGRFQVCLSPTCRVRAFPFHKDYLVVLENCNISLFLHIRNKSEIRRFNIKRWTSTSAMGPLQ